MTYHREYKTYANGAKQLVAYIAENGKRIECEYESGGLSMKTSLDWYWTEHNGELEAFDTLREAKQVLETGKSDLDLWTTLTYKVGAYDDKK